MLFLWGWGVHSGRVSPAACPVHLGEEHWQPGEDSPRDQRSDSCVTPWTIGLQAPLSMGFLWQEHWSGLPFPSPGDLPDPETEPPSPALAGKFFTTEAPGKPQ